MAVLTILAGLAEWLRDACSTVVLRYYCAEKQPNLVSISLCG